MEIRTASLQDLEDIAAVEAACFPVAEAATKAEFAERIQHYGDHFFLLYDKQKLIAFVDGFVTDEQNLTDEMYEKASLHNENGAWQMIFGVHFRNIEETGMRDDCFAVPLILRESRGERALYLLVKKS